MGRFEGKQLVKRKSTSYREGRCTIIRGDTAWVVMHRGHYIGECDTYCEAEVLSQRETGRLDSLKDDAVAQAAMERAEHTSEACHAAREMGLSIAGINMDGTPDIV